jgi:hypothetical protein
MPGDPKECRQHALQCAVLAQQATSTTAREAFGRLVHIWIQLATELERTQALLDEGEERDAELARAG